MDELRDRVKAALETVELSDVHVFAEPLSANFPEYVHLHVVARVGGAS